MGTETLPDSVTVAAGLLIKSADFLTTNAALQAAFVGRNTSGVPASGQSLGTALYPWGNLYANAITIGGSAIDVSQIVSPANRIVSGAVRTTSGQPLFLDADGAAATVKVLGLTTNLVLSINSASVTVSTDISETGLTTAPGSNNTCAINDTSFTDQAESKYFGEIDSQKPIITIDTVGTEISSRVGQFIALKTDTSEIMWGWLKSATELTNVKRGYFFDSAATPAPIVRETLINDEVLTLLETGWIFMTNDGLTVDVTYLTPVYAYTAPTSPVATQYWYDISNVTWKRYSGSAWVDVGRVPLGLCVIDTSNCVAVRPFDFYGNFQEENTIDCEVFSDEVVRSVLTYNSVNVYGTELTMDNYPVEWDNTTDMETGSVTTDATYYLYLSTTGQPKISLERPYDRTGDLRGRYHPYNNWRYICDAKTDGSSDWLSVISSSAFDNQAASASFDADNLLIDVTSSTQVTVTYDRLKLINALGQSKTLYNGSHVFDITIHNQGAELASHWYQLWIDSFGRLKLVPDLTGTADGTTAGFIDDSANLFATYSVFKSAIAYNLTDLTQTTVSVSATVDNNDLAVTDDIFVSGEDYKIHMLDPVGLGEFKANIGAAYNNGSSNIAYVQRNNHPSFKARITNSFWHTQNGYGATNTKVRKFTTEVVSSDDVVGTITNLAGAAANDGFRVVANMKCLAEITYTDSGPAGAFWAGLTKNSTELTTNLQSLTTVADRLTTRQVAADSVPVGSTYVGILEKDDFIVPHTNGGAASSVTTYTSIHVVLTEIPGDHNGQ